MPKGLAAALKFSSLVKKALAHAKLATLQYCACIAHASLQLPYASPSTKALLGRASQHVSWSSPPLLHAAPTHRKPIKSLFSSCVMAWQANVLQVARASQQVI
jgi:hypothetical protein